MDNKFLLAALCLLYFIFPYQDLYADSGLDDDGVPFVGKKWKERPAYIPPYPLNKNLLRIPLQERDTVKAYVDKTTLDRGKDWVIRYTLVIESNTGVRNVFFEGLRCATYEYKTYAIGVTKKVLTPIKNPEWRRIPTRARNAIRDTLYNDFFCDKNLRANDPKSIIQSIKYPEDTSD